MKVLLLCLFLFLREASCGIVEGPAYGAAAVVAETGTSTVHRSQDALRSRVFKWAPQGGATEFSFMVNAAAADDFSATRALTLRVQSSLASIDQRPLVMNMSQQVNGNYDFGYEEKHTSGGSFRQETGDAYGNKVGSYGLHDADGRVRIVKYVADANGFRVIVNTNEPGTAPSAPAAASINVPQPPVVPAPAPVATVVSGGPVVPVATAPVATVAAAPPPVAVQAAPVIKTVVPAAPVLQPAPVFSAPAPVVKTVVSSGPLVQAAPVLKTLLPAAPVVQPAPVFPAPGPIVKTVVSSGPFVQRAPIFSAPAPVATFSAAPAAVTTFKRFIPASVFGAGPVAAPVVQTVGLPPPPVYGFRRGFAAGPVLAGPAAASYSTGFVPSLPYATSGPAFARRVVVRKIGAPGGYGAFGGGYGGAFKGGYGAGGYGGGVNFLKGAATSFASPAVLAAPGGYGAKLSAGAPSYSYGAGSVVPSTAFNAYASKPLDYYEHLANKLGATYLKRRR